MGDSPEAIEGQAKLFRVLLAYAKYSPLVGYSQGINRQIPLLPVLGCLDFHFGLEFVCYQNKYVNFMPRTLCYDLKSLI